MKKLSYFNFIFLLMIAFIPLLTIHPVSQEIPESSTVNGKWEDLVKDEIDGLSIDGSNLGKFFSGGNGTASKPYLISSSLDLARLSYLSNKSYGLESYYELTNDIDLSGKQWTPISLYYSNAFKGSFDGKNHLIKNLTMINHDCGGKTGFIDELSYGHVMNLGFINAYIDTRNINTVSNAICVGSINDNASVNNIMIYRSKIYTKGATTIGGVVGWGNGSVENCMSDIDIFVQGTVVTYYISPMIGTIRDAALLVKNCCSYGSIEINQKSGEMNSGGIFATNYNNILGAVIENCYSATKFTFHITPDSYGGIGGKLTENSHIKNCYNKTNLIKAIGSNLGNNLTTVYDRAPTINQLPSKYWAQNEYINNGDPYLKNFYW